MLLHVVAQIDETKRTSKYVDVTWKPRVTDCQGSGQDEENAVQPRRRAHQSFDRQLRQLNARRQDRHPR